MGVKKLLDGFEVGLYQGANDNLLVLSQVAEGDYLGPIERLYENLFEDYELLSLYSISQAF